MRADREDKVIMPLSCTRQEIAGISGLLSAMQSQSDGLEALADIDFAALEKLYLVGSGDSYAIALMVEAYLNRCGAIRCRAVQSFTFLGLSAAHFSAGSLVVVISASGRPSPVLDAFAHALTMKAGVVGMTNSPGSPFANLSSRMLFTQACKKGMPTQSSSATLFLLMKLAERIIQAKTAVPEITNVDIPHLSQDWENVQWQTWLTKYAEAFFSRRVIFLGNGITWGMAYLSSNLMACGPQIEASFFPIEEYCHALRLNQANQQHLVVMFPEKDKDQALCSSIQQRLIRQGALSYCFAPPGNFRVHDYLQRNMLLLFQLSLTLAERYVAMGGERVTFEDIK
ncbi:SIS domain-containing protein [Klebsiella sp. RHBSTW-00215]|uniref:SIS domain-containing protein n=1 Tax=Klebsiella sp. RHBSTW-00215 TaxID=2742640 RepID=UPI0015F6117E|nr:SIS domain-containing protein [Klebsiella sp. RHBSTW-00215]MBA7932588.1 SIS domain-containing protein [Klebsiella sp. RHBSTW-00215]